MKRRPIQIAIAQSDEKPAEVAALLEDGSIWVCILSNESRWIQLPPIPESKQA